MLMKSAASMVAWLTLAISPACPCAAAVRPLADNSKNPAMSCTKFSQTESKNNGMDVDNHCSSNVNIMIVLYDKSDYYLINMWHNIEPDSSAITGIPEDPNDDEFYVHPDKHGFTEYYIACSDKGKKCNSGIDCVRAKGRDDGGIVFMADAIAVAEDCGIELFGGKSE
mgnify:CR=1 FL=1